MKAVFAALGVMLAVLAAGWAFQTWRTEALLSQPRLALHFDHGRHMSVECNTCHHNFKRVEARFASVPDQRCVACHKLMPEEAVRIESVFHNFCMGCHLDQARIDKPHGPVRACGQCHQSTPGTDLILHRRMPSL